MEKNKDLIRCTNCWEGFDWEENPLDDMGDGPDRLPGVGQTVVVLAWEKWFSHIFDVIQLEFLSGEKSCSGDVG